MPRKALVNRTVTIGLPTVATVVLSLVAGGLQVVNQLVLAGHPEWQAYITVFLVFLVGIGITPLTGSAFSNALHLPAWANTLVIAVIGAASGVLQIASLGTAGHTIVATALTVLAALGFGANPLAILPVPAPVKDKGK